jgi:hypothetical protein
LYGGYDRYNLIKKKHGISFTRTKRIEIVMQEDSLNYRSSGVDVEAYNRASARIKALIQDTFGSQILTQAGLFGAAISLKGYGGKLNRPLLSGSLGIGDSLAEDELADQIVRACAATLPPSAQPVAFLDYIAAAQLDLTRAVGLVGAFSRILSRDRKIPMAGGETAEMPGGLRCRRHQHLNMFQYPRMLGPLQVIQRSIWRRRPVLICLIRPWCSASMGSAPRPSWG